MEVSREVMMIPIFDQHPRRDRRALRKLLGLDGLNREGVAALAFRALRCFGQISTHKNLPRANKPSGYYHQRPNL